MRSSGEDTWVLSPLPALPLKSPYTAIGHTDNIYGESRVVNFLWASHPDISTLHRLLGIWTRDLLHVEQTLCHWSTASPIVPPLFCRFLLMLFLFLKKIPRFFLSCLGYPTCKSAVWFPDSLLEVSKDDSIREVCRPHPVHMWVFS